MYSRILTFEGLSVFHSNTTEADLHVTMLKLVQEFATPGYTCLRPPGAAGAILDHRFGYILGCAEPPVGPTCKDLGECMIEDGHCVRTIHAEVNALLLAARYGITAEGSTLYSLLKPCYKCTQAIIAAGVSRVIYASRAYDEDRTNEALKAAHIEIFHVDIGLNYGF